MGSNCRSKLYFVSLVAQQTTFYYIFVILVIYIVCHRLISVGKQLFSKMAEDQSHPLFSHPILNVSKKSSRRPCKSYPAETRTKKRTKSFFTFFLTHCYK